jgi:hypothetical protein
MLTEVCTGYFSGTWRKMRSGWSRVRWRTSSLAGLKSLPDSTMLSLWSPPAAHGIAGSGASSRIRTSCDGTDSQLTRESPPCSARGGCASSPNSGTAVELEGCCFCCNGARVGILRHEPTSGTRGSHQGTHRGGCICVSHWRGDRCDLTATTKSLTCLGDRCCSVDRHAGRYAARPIGSPPSRQDTAPERRSRSFVLPLCGLSGI